MICSRCGKKIEDFVIVLKQEINVLKKTEQGNFEQYGSINEPTFEYLCPDCLDKYAECLNQLNQDYSGKYLIDMVEVIDDVQYGE